MGDSTTAMGWLKRSNFKEKDEDDNEWLVKQQVARKLANLVLESDTMLYQQWFKGEFNTVSDSLSRDCYFLSHKLHSNFLKKSVPSQLPSNFHIKPVPTEISCFITLIL